MWFSLTFLKLQILKLTSLRVWCSDSDKPKHSKDPDLYPESYTYVYYIKAHDFPLPK